MTLSDETELELLKNVLLEKWYDPADQSITLKIKYPEKLAIIRKPKPTLMTDSHWYLSMILWVVENKLKAKAETEGCR